MENQKNALETKRNGHLESASGIEIGVEAKPKSVDSREQVERDVEEREQRAAADLEQADSLSSAIKSAPIESGEEQSSGSLFSDIPGNTPEEKLLYLLNDYDPDKSKQIVEGLDQLSNQGN